MTNSEGDDRMIQIGVVSWGYGCAQTDARGQIYPGFAANPTKVMSWINQTISKKEGN